MNPERLYQLEACVTTLSQARHAELSGADRIEICSQLDTGGMTPDFNLVSDLCRQLTIPIRVMIRNTEKGFEANESILNKMIHSIEKFKSLPIDGFVIGLLKNNLVDKEAMKIIIGHTSPLLITFHMAIDQSVSIADDIAWMNGVRGIDTILTSGGAVNVVEGADQILRMKSIFKGTIMAGGKIVPHQLPTLDKKLGLEWYHGRKIVGELIN